MNKSFNNIKELITALKREEKLISEMFIKRRSLNYRRTYALELVDYEEERIQYLVEHSVLRENGMFLEIDDQYLDFFEQVLDVNEEINISTINENIGYIKENIEYYLSESNENRKYGYLKYIKRTLRKIGVITLRNVIDLRRNIENTFKNEPNYKIKKRKLENLDEKRTAISSLIKQTYLLVDQDELTFFKTATDEALNDIIIDLKVLLRESSHNLIEIEKQIIDYLNQIKQHGKFIEKLRKLKYLKDQFLIEADTDIKQILSNRNEVLFETRTHEPLKLSVDFLNTDDTAYELIVKVARQHKNRKPVNLEVAGTFSDDDLTMGTEEEIAVDPDEIKNQFAATGNNLFDFIMHYDFKKEIDFRDKVTLYCQIASQFENELIIENKYQQYRNVEFALIYPK